MAGISRIGDLKKRLVANGFVAAAAAGGGSFAFPPLLTVFRRITHESVYEKNVDQLNATSVPDEVIKPESDKYWAPNPSTGVFGPESGAQPSGATKGPSAASQNSVLEDKAWFRSTSLEDLDKSTKSPNSNVSG